MGVGSEGMADEASIGVWRPIASAPSDGSRVLIFAPPDWIDVANFSDGQWVDESLVASEELPTHWMPLPAPPVLGPGKPEKP